MSYSLTGLANAERDRGRYADAEKLYAQALAWRDASSEGGAADE